MKKYDPISEFSERLKYLVVQEVIWYDDIMKFNHLGLKVDLYDKCLNPMFKKEFQLNYIKETYGLLIFLKENLDKIVSRILKNLTIGFYRSNGEPLEMLDVIIIKKSLLEEIETYYTLAEVLIDKDILLKLNNTLQKHSIKVQLPPNKKSGRREIISTFIGIKKLNPEQIVALFDLTFPKRNKDQLFDNSNKKSRKEFIEIMNLANVKDISERNYKIKLEAENYMLAFVFSWFEINYFIKSPFKAIENSASFYSSNDSLLTQNDLSKGKASYSNGNFITTQKPKTEPKLNDPQDKTQYFGYLNFHLHFTFN